MGNTFTVILTTNKIIRKTLEIKDLEGLLNMSKNTKDIVNQSKYLCWIFSAFEILAELTMGWIMLKINVSQGERMVK
jgi:hypothetical protein